jgi:hypothetical protein
MSLMHVVGVEFDKFTPKPEGEVKTLIKAVVGQGINDTHQHYI